MVSTEKAFRIIEIIKSDDVIKITLNKKEI